PLELFEQRQVRLQDRVGGSGGGDRRREPCLDREGVRVGAHGWLRGGKTYSRRRSFSTSTRPSSGRSSSSSHSSAAARLPASVRSSFRRPFASSSSWLRRRRSATWRRRWAASMPPLSKLRMWLPSPRRASA